MKLEPALQSEASQKEKNKYSILTPMYGMGNNGTDEPICREGLETQMQRMEEGGSGTNGDIASTYAHYHVWDDWLV